MCPENVPDVGSSCVDYVADLTCDYAYCYDATVPTVRCDGASWRWVSLPIPTCNPPPPEPECASEPPLAGTSCVYEGLICSYGTCGQPGYAWLECRDGAWSGNELPCPPPAGDAGAGDGGG